MSPPRNSRLSRDFDENTEPRRKKRKRRHQGKPKKSRAFSDGRKQDVKQRKSKPASRSDFLEEELDFMDDELDDEDEMGGIGQDDDMLMDDEDDSDNGA